MEISEAAKRAADDLMVFTVTFLPSCDGTVRMKMANIIQQAIDEATAEKDAEIERLREERLSLNIARNAAIHRVQELAQQVHLLICNNKYKLALHRIIEERDDTAPEKAIRIAKQALTGGEG